MVNILSRDHSRSVLGRPSRLQRDNLNISLGAWRRRTGSLWRYKFLINSFPKTERRRGASHPRTTARSIHRCSAVRFGYLFTVERRRLSRHFTLTSAFYSLSFSCSLCIFRTGWHFLRQLLGRLKTQQRAGSAHLNRDIFTVRARATRRQRAHALLFARE